MKILDFNKKPLWSYAKAAKVKKLKQRQSRVVVNEYETEGYRWKKRRYGHAGGKKRRVS
jgi:hypothetical protein